MNKSSILIGKIFLLLVTSFCLIQCNEGEGVVGSGGEIEINDSLPGGSYNFAVSDINVTRGEHSLTLSWQAPEDVSDLAYYLVEWRGNNSDPTLYSAPCHTTTYTITRLYNDSYTIGVRGVSKNFQKSDIVYSSTSYTPLEDLEGPDKVSNLSISTAAVSTLLSWANPSNEDFEYTVVRLKEAAETEWRLSDTLSALDTEWNVTGLSESTTYEYAVQSFDYIGNGSELASGSFRTKTEVQLQKTDTLGNPLWEIVDYSSEETGGDSGQAANAIDGNNSTFWHSVWYRGNFGDGSNTGTLPQYIVIDMKQTVIPSVVSLYRRDGRTTGPTSVKIESTVEEPSRNTEWTDLGTYALDGGTNNGALRCYIRLQKDARYIKITILAAASGTYAQLREVDINALVDDE